ncbi:nitrate reductase molybdenum cofactor assembly chaperone [Kitasatospora sp. NPDC058965]|uniref:nitrate reductase molybdenum cofactor assembly chaperone n=1 Tax=Kitasatospora sp. NPDC058965 TaxID=3346682 RepID=UPI00368396D6
MTAAVVHQAAAHCLGYPDPDQDLALVRAAVAELRGPAARELTAFLAHTPSAGHYTEVFDFTNRHSLYLSWWTDGDTRRRGTALLAFQDAYRARGFRLAAAELPDFLPVVLEFCAATGDDALLREHRPALELLRLALTEAGTPYAHVLAAVCATLPGPSPADRAQAMALARSGPPREEVGREPYGHLAHLPVLSGGH